MPRKSSNQTMQLMPSNPKGSQIFAVTRDNRDLGA